MVLVSMKSTNLQSNIMRRVYYTYAISIFTHIVFWQGLFFSVATLMLAKWLHVSSIINNFLSVPVGSVPNYLLGSFFGAISEGKVLTALTLVFAVGIAISVGYRLINEVAPKFFTMSRA